MSFRDVVAADNLSVFSNTGEFATLHTIIYDGKIYENAPCIISKLKAKDRVITTKDHAQGLFFVTVICHFSVGTLNGNIPEKGGKIGISDETGFVKYYYVAQAGCDMEMVRLELEAYDE